MILGLFTELLSIGGVQRAGRHTAAVLAAYAEARAIPYRFLSLNDPLGPHRLSTGATQFTVSGFARQKARFIRTALSAMRTRPGLLVAAHPNLAPLAWAIRALQAQTRSIVLTHGIEVWTPLPSWRRRTLRRADRVLAPSTHTAGQLVSLQRVPEEKIRRLPWALDPQFPLAPLNPERNHLPPGLPPGRVILTVGRWAVNERYKGVDTLIHALPVLLPVVPDLQLLAVGDGDDRGRLEELAASRGVSDHVCFLRELGPDQLIACYARSDIFALPSSGEGFGLVFLEAMAQGKPVIGGAHGGTPDIIEDGVTGFLVRHGDVEELAHKLRKLLTDDALRWSMGCRARERVRSTYLFEHFQARLEQIIAELCAS